MLICSLIEGLMKVKVNLNGPETSVSNRLSNNIYNYLLGAHFCCLENDINDIKPYYLVIKCQISPPTPDFSF
jgi:hypothetical protein